MSYRQLTPEQRYQIWACLRMKMKRSEIAREIGVHRSTVGRELKRNASGRWKYNPSRAIGMARERHRQKRKARIGEAIWVRVETLLGRDWSPAEVTDRLKLEGLPSVSHETIYLHLSG